MSDVPEAPAAYFRFFGRTAASHGSPLYERLAFAVADDADLLDLASECRPGQPSANMLFAAAHYLLLGGTDHPLKAHYPSLGGTEPADARLVALFKDFCGAHMDAVRALIKARVTNTNEVQRCAVLAPGLCRVAEAAGQPLALIELGPSAGLNLNFDRYAYRYAYRYVDDGAAFERWAPSPLTIDCALRGSSPPLADKPPPVLWRRGVDLNRVDLALAEDRLWLRALIWPDRVDRLRRLEAALEIARDAPPVIAIGDAAEILPALIAEAPIEAALCIFHSAFLYQVPAETRTRLDEICRRASFDRPIARLSYDWAGIEGQTPLMLRQWRGGALSATHLANSDDHGQWICWLA